AGLYRRLRRRNYRQAVRPAIAVIEFLRGSKIFDVVDARGQRYLARCFHGIGPNLRLRPLKGARGARPCHRHASTETVASLRSDPPNIFQAPWVSPPATMMLMSSGRNI